MRSNEHKLNQVEFHLNVGKKLFPWSTGTTPGMETSQTHLDAFLGDPAVAGGLDWVICRDPFPTQTIPRSYERRIRINGARIRISAFARGADKIFIQECPGHSEHPFLAKLTSPFFTSTRRHHEAGGTTEQIPARLRAGGEERPVLRRHPRVARHLGQLLLRRQPPLRGHHRGCQRWGSLPGAAPAQGKCCWEIS